MGSWTRQTMGRNDRVKKKGVSENNVYCNYMSIWDRIILHKEVKQQERVVDGVLIFVPAKDNILFTVHVLFPDRVTPVDYFFNNLLIYLLTYLITYLFFKCVLQPDTKRHFILQVFVCLFVLIFRFNDIVMKQRENITTRLLQTIVCLTINQNTSSNLKLYYKFISRL